MPDGCSPAGLLERFSDREEGPHPPVALTTRSGRAGRVARNHSRRPSRGNLPTPRTVLRYCPPKKIMASRASSRLSSGNPLVISRSEERRVAVAISDASSSASRRGSAIRASRHVRAPSWARRSRPRSGTARTARAGAGRVGAGRSALGPFGAASRLAKHRTSSPSRSRSSCTRSAVVVPRQVSFSSSRTARKRRWWWTV